MMLLSAFRKVATESAVAVLGNKQAFGQVSPMLVVFCLILSLIAALLLQFIDV